MWVCLLWHTWAPKLLIDNFLGELVYFSWNWWPRSGFLSPILSNADKLTFSLNRCMSSAELNYLNQSYFMSPVSIKILISGWKSGSFGPHFRLHHFLPSCQLLRWNLALDCKHHWVSIFIPVVLKIRKCFEPVCGQLVLNKWRTMC